MIIKKAAVLLLSIFFIASSSFSSPTPDLIGERTVNLAVVDGAIGPTSAEFIVEAIETSESDEAECLIIELDTPGGLDASMRVIVKRIMAAEVPVVVYVFPSGSRAASAGAFIMLAAHFAAMTPGTNVGAAHPVQIGAGGALMDTTLAEKATNDAAAYIRTIAEKRNRDIEWAEDAVRKSVSATESEALEIGIIDFVCEDVSALLDSLDGAEAELPSSTRTLQTKGAEIKEIQMGLRRRILSAISNPNIAYILMMLGIYGLIFELSNPGAILPGVVGGICLILAFFGLQTLSVNYSGLLLIAFAVILFIAELKTPTHGILTVGGIISLTLGSLMLFESPEPFLRVSWKVIIATVSFTTLFFILAVGMGLRARKKEVFSGSESLLGKIGEARTDIKGKGTVFLMGEHWNAESDLPISKGDKVNVISTDRSVLKVSKIET